MTAKLLALDVLTRRIATMDYLVASELVTGPIPPGRDRFSKLFARFHGPQANAAEDLTIGGLALAARNAFVEQLSGFAVQTMESLFLLDANQTLTFGGITSTGTNLLCEDWTGLGRFNTTAGGAQYIQTDNSGSAIFTFSAPIYAFGFYGTDFGDFDSAFMMHITFTDGSKMHFHWQGLGNTPRQTLFTGFISPNLGVTDVRVMNMGGMHTTPAVIDVFGYDDIMVATSAQVALVLKAYGYSYPDPFENTYTFEATHWVRFDWIAYPDFPNAYDDIGVNYGNHYYRAVDSVSDSVAAGTFVTDGPFAGSGCYRIVAGSRCTVECVTRPQDTARILALIQNPNYVDAFCIDGFIRRTGASVGAGRVLNQSGFFSVSIESNLLVARITISADGLPFTVTMTAVNILALNAWTYFQISMVRVNNPAGAGAQAVSRFVLYLGGAMEYDSGTAWSDSFGHNTIIPAYAGVGNLVIGGESGSNYGRADLAEVRVSRVVRADIPLPAAVPTSPPWRPFEWQ